MTIKIFYDLKSASRFLDEYESSRMDYEDMFKNTSVRKVEVSLKMDRPESAKFHFTRDGKSDTSTVTFKLNF